MGQTAARGDNSGKKGKGLIQKHVRKSIHMYNGVGIDCGSQRWAGQRRAKREKLGQL